MAATSGVIVRTLGLLSLLISTLCYAGDSTASISRTIGADIVTSLHDAGSYLCLPLHFSSSEWLLVAGAAGGTLLLMTADERVRDNVGAAGRGNYNKDILDVPTAYGSVPFAGLFALTTYATGLAAKSDDIRITGRLMCESLVLAGATSFSIRVITGRTRPFAARGAWDFNWFETKDVMHSFPSGHTTAAFALSTVLAERLDTFWARVGFYGMATWTAYARVYNRQHWLSDVALGAGVGLLAGFHVVREEERRTSKLPVESSRLQVYPTLNGVSVVYSLR